MARLSRMGSSRIDWAITGKAVAIIVESSVCINSAHPTMVGIRILAWEAERDSVFIPDEQRHWSAWLAAARSQRYRLLRGSYVGQNSLA